MILLELDLVGFLGRFHPLVVHLPIGFLLLGGLMEYLIRKNKVSGSSNWIFLAGAIAAVVAAAMGWMLAEAGGYDPNSLFWHRWLGILVAVIALVIWLAKSGKISFSAPVFSLMLIALMVLVGVTGHFGGNLTHGDDYLWEYAPDGLRKLLGPAPEEAVILAADPDSVMVFAQLIQPMLEKRCVTCHNPDIKKGKLDLSSLEGLEEGGSDGECIKAGDALGSELFKRITLSPDHKKFMPANGNTPLSYNEVKLIEWWIDSGADFETSVQDTGVPEDIKFVLAQTHGLDTDPKAYVERMSVPAAPAQVLQKFQDAGLVAQPIAMENNFLEVRRIPGSPAESLDLSILQEVGDQVTWLHLSKSELQDQDLTVLGSLPNLTLLRLDNNPISDAGIRALEGLSHLESLNLYGTKVTLEVAETLKSMPALKRVFLWQTGLSDEELQQIREELPEVEVIGGATL